MAVDQPNVVDVVSINNSTGEVMLTISDHLDWTDTTSHQMTLQKKFNGYLAFVESGEIYQQYADAEGRPVVFKVVFRFRPDKEGLSFLERAKEVIESAGLRLQHEVFAESYNN